MTLHVLEGHFPIASLFKCDISYLWRVARSRCICGASCLVLSGSRQVGNAMIQSYCVYADTIHARDYDRSSTGIFRRSSVNRGNLPTHRRDERLRSGGFGHFNRLPSYYQGTN